MSVEYRGEKFEGYNKPKKTPKHPSKSHAVLAKEGDTIKLIRFGEQGAETAGKPKAGESDRMKKKRASFKARHAKNIKRGKLSAAYWADKVKW
jgi:hypothetical protein|tara:strand:+ start:354 stop:632 length:279 start_codon:yes stop_codon:yes gene_type:complete